MDQHDQPKLASRGRVRDQRGRKVTQLDPVAMHLLRQHAVIDADVLRAIASERGVRIKPGERAALIGGICVALAVTSLITHALITGDIRDAPYAKSAGFLYLLSIPWIIWFGIKRKRFSHVAAAMLKHLRCPHCGYDIRNLPIDPVDGATVCPECGCAWKVDNSIPTKQSGNDDHE